MTRYDKRAILFIMEETLGNKTFDALDENELNLVLNQVARRMLVLRAGVPDASLWYGVLMRVGKWLRTEPVLNDTEKNFLIDPPLDNGKPISGRIRAIRNMRERSGGNLSACKEIIDAWIKDNFDAVHSSVRESWLCNKQNMESRANVSK